jgi:hypothetical protein
MQNITDVQFRTLGVSQRVDVSGISVFSWEGRLAGGIDWGFLAPNDEQRRRVLEGID